MNALTPLSEATALPLTGAGPLPFDHPLFAGLPLSDIAEIGSVMSCYRFKDDALIVADDVPLVGIILAGAVARIAKQGDQVSTVGLLLPNDLLILEGPRTAAIHSEAVGLTEILGCSAPEFDALLRRFPKLQLNYLDLVASELQATREWYTLLGRKTAPERVATLILKLSRHSDHPDSPVIDLRLTRDRIGTLLGLKMETVSRQIRAFAKLGIIALFSPTKIEVLDHGALMHATGDVWREKTML